MAINHLESFHAASIQWRSDLCLCDSLDQVIGLLKNFRECKKAETKDIKTFVQGKVHIEMIALLYPADERNQLRPPSPRKVSQIQSRYDRTFWTTNQPRILRSRSNPDEIPPLAPATNTKYKVQGKVRG